LNQGIQAIYGQSCAILHAATPTIEHGACVLRINTTDGKFDTFVMDKSHWLMAENDDLAICVVPFHSDRLNVRAIPRGMFLRQGDIKSENAGPGDEIILIGRFINQEGKERNIPSARFGHISQMPIEPIEYEGIEQESFLCPISGIHRIRV
jgi:hypothetical protein